MWLLGKRATLGQLRGLNMQASVALERLDWWTGQGLPHRECMLEETAAKG